MITEWLVQVGNSCAQFIAGMFPELEIPDELVNVDDSINQLMAYGDGLGAWVDWPLITLLAGLPFLVWAASLTIRATRVLLSHIPMFGGRG